MMGSVINTKEPSIGIKGDRSSPASILRNLYDGKEKEIEERTRNRSMAASGTNRYRVGVSPVRVKRSTNESVPTAVVTPSPPVGLSAVRLTPSASLPLKPNHELSANRYITFSGDHTALVSSPTELIYSSLDINAAVFSPIGTPIGSSTLSRRSRSSIGHNGFGLMPRKLEYDEHGEKDKTQSQQQKWGKWLGDNLDEENQAASNSILTLHLPDTNRSTSPIPRDESQERRLKELETRLKEIEMRLLATTKFGKTDGSRVTSEMEQSMNGEKTGSNVSPTSKPRSPVTKGSGDYHGLSVAVPPMIAMDSGVFRVQPTTRSETKVQREIERMEKKLKQQQETAETLRSQHFKQIEQLTRQLASNNDVIQTLRSRIRELELENELWQNRVRLYNDVDVAKILRENERLRSAHKRRLNGEDGEETQKDEHLEEELVKVRARYEELEKKYRSNKEKYKETIRTIRNQMRQNRIELESLKVTVALQNSELSDLRKRLFGQIGTNVSEVASANTSQIEQQDSELLSHNLQKCFGIIDCLSKICTRIKHRQPLDPEEVLNYETASDKHTDTTGDKWAEDYIDQVASNLMQLHSKVIDIYGDELANSVTCNVQ